MTAVERQWTALTRGVGLYEDGLRSVWSIEGERAVDALHGLLTNDLLSAARGQVVPCLALTPKGRPIADLRVWKHATGEGSVILDLCAEGQTELLTHFGRYLPPRFATTVPMPEAKVFRLRGPLAAGALHALFGADLVLPAGDRFVRVELRAGSDPDLEGRSADPFLLGRIESEGGGWDILLTAEDPELEGALLHAVESAGGCSVGPDAWDIWRVERGIPRYGRDFGSGNLPQETGLTERTVSFEKGCYTGQEVVARIHYRGHVNQRLMGLEAPGDEPLPHAAELFREQKASGRITSPVQSPRFGSIALGMIRREVDPGTAVSLSPASNPDIMVRTLPFTSS
jgi:aminomethyltransferase